MPNQNKARSLKSPTFFWHWVAQRIRKPMERRETPPQPTYQFIWALCNVEMHTNYIMRRHPNEIMMNTSKPIMIEASIYPAGNSLGTESICSFLSAAAGINNETEVWRAATDLNALILCFDTDACTSVIISRPGQSGAAISLHTHITGQSGRARPSLAHSLGLS